MSKEITIRIGTVGFPINQAKVLRDVDVVERNEGKGIPPKAATAKKWASEMGTQVEAVVQLSEFLVTPPPAGTTLPGDLSGYGNFRISDENQGLWSKSLDFAQNMNANVCTLWTPSGFTPSQVNWTSACQFLGKVDRRGLQIVWEPKGPWEQETSARFAEENDLILAVDPLRDEAPHGSMAYFRLGPFAAMGSRMGIYDLERIAEAATFFDEVYCVFDTRNALDDARNLKRLLRDEGIVDG